ncbi:MAG: transposase [Xenococcaceae cyanobacterium MO_167.B27]|nr:transposase [Xenococcaceae cyanobacterium MO_167.B27]
MTPNSVRKIRVYPCKELHRIWKQWLAAYRWIYNWTMAKLKSGCSDSAYRLQSQARNSERPEWIKQLPGHQLQEAVADGTDAYWQAKKNGGDGNFKSCRAYSQVIKFKVGNYKKGTWYAKTTKKLPFVAQQSIPTESIYGTQLVYQKGKWYGCFPEHIPTEPTNESKVIALDPGSRAFVTGYDGETVLEVGKKDIGRINRLCTHLDQLMSRIQGSKSKRQRYKQRTAAGRIREKIKNLIKDLHNKVSSFLVNNYKVIFLPTFESSQMVLKQQRKINSKTARNMLTWSHFRFAQHLTQMAARNNCIVVKCNESYTSKTCPECGTIHEKLGSSQVFNCPHCRYKAGRDANGARNIMIRAMRATAITFSSDAIHLISSL